MHLTWYVPYLYLIILVRWLNYKRKILTNIDIHVVIVDPSSDLHIGIFFLQFYISNFHSLYLPLCYEHFYFLFLVQLVFLEDWPGSQFRSSFKFFRKKILMVSHSLTSQVKFARQFLFCNKYKQYSIYAFSWWFLCNLSSSISCRLNTSRKTFLVLFEYQIKIII